jgi:NAD-dependent deacetylase
MNLPPLDIRPDSAEVLLTGAGISAESGIATFRDSGGLWEQHDVSQVATPEGFRSNPGLVWRFYSERRRQASLVHPNPGHFAVSALEQFLASRGRFTLVTQNVDGLHQRAGSQRVLAVHGSLFKTRCSSSECAQGLCSWEDHSLHFQDVPLCPGCGSMLRPDIVWFGEYLDPAIESAAREAIADCDLFLAIGTSGAVWPVAGYVDIALARGARTVLVNLELPANANRFAEVHLGKSADLLPRLLPGG